MTDETSQLLSDTAEKLFSDHVTKNCIIDAEKGTWPEELWSEVKKQAIADDIQDFWVVFKVEKDS